MRFDFRFHIFFLWYLNLLASCQTILYFDCIFFDILNFFLGFRLLLLRLSLFLNNLLFWIFLMFLTAYLSRSSTSWLQMRQIHLKLRLRFFRTHYPVSYLSIFSNIHEPFGYILYIFFSYIYKDVSIVLDYFYVDVFECKYIKKSRWSIFIFSGNKKLI